MSKGSLDFSSRIIAHRGAKLVSPENTLAAIAKAADFGAKWVEIDAALSADGVPVIIHDATLDRTTNGRGPVDQQYVEVLTKLDAGSWFAPEFAGEAIPTLEQAAELISTRGLSLNLELKPQAGQVRPHAEAIVEVLSRCWPEVATLILSSFNTTVLKAVGDLAPAIPRALLCDEVPDNWRDMMTELKCVSFNCNRKSVTAELVRDVKEAGYWFLSFTVNEVGTARKF